MQFICVYNLAYVKVHNQICANTLKCISRLSTSLRFDGSSISHQSILVGSPHKSVKQDSLLKVSLLLLEQDVAVLSDLDPQKPGRVFHRQIRRHRGLLRTLRLQQKPLLQRLGKGLDHFNLIAIIDRNGFNLSSEWVGAAPAQNLLGMLGNGSDECVM